jgi:hypothetical protein
MAPVTAQARRSSWRELFTGPPPAIRTVEVLPPSHSGEAAGVFLSAAFIYLCVFYILAFQLYEPQAAGDRRSATAVLPFQVLFPDLPSPEQRIFRQMQEGLAEALQTRGARGEWPTVESLATQSIPPFTHDVLDKSALTWTQHRDGAIVAYVGIPAPGAAMPAFLIFIQEPEPTGGEQPSAAVIDEEHQLLPDGKLLHVTYWKHVSASLKPGPVLTPELAGWTQIRVTSPYQAMEEQ